MVIYSPPCVWFILIKIFLEKALDSPIDSRSTGTSCAHPHHRHRLLAVKEGGRVLAFFFQDSCQPIVNCWFGILGFLSERDYCLGGTMIKSQTKHPNQQLAISWSMGTTKKHMLLFWCLNIWAKFRTRRGIEELFFLFLSGFIWHVLEVGWKQNVRFETPTVCLRIWFPTFSKWSLSSTQPDARWVYARPASLVGVVPFMAMLRWGTHGLHWEKVE